MAKVQSKLIERREENNALEYFIKPILYMCGIRMTAYLNLIKNIQIKIKFFAAFLQGAAAKFFF